MAQGSRTRRQAIAGAMTRAEWMRLGGFGAAVAGINIAGWTLLLVASVAGHSAIGLGVGVTAWVFGFRHAFDADHISAIDNTTRKLLADGQKPIGVGFFFSLGHSTIVFALSLVIAVAASAVSGSVGKDTGLHNLGFYIGTSVSAFFLFLIAFVNLVILRGIYRIFLEMRNGTYDEHTLEQRLQERGLINRLLGPLARSIKHSWQMYPLGVLFGLGFDTATEVGLLALSGGVAAAGLPWYATLSLPLLFAGGMSLMDTADGAFMNVAYGWAFSQPVRKVFYNLAVTGLSVAVAVLIGGIELIQLATTYFGLTGGAWDVLRNIDLNLVGIAIVGLFVVTWAVALAVWKYGRIEDRWSAGMAAAALQSGADVGGGAHGYTGADVHSEELSTR